MKSRISGILIGSFLILTGLIFYFNDILFVNSGTLITFVSGIFLILYYILINKKWSLVLGSYLIYLTTVNCFDILPFVNLNRFFYTTGGFICCSGLIFDVIYIRERKPGQLTAGLGLTAAGISVISGLPLFDSILTGIGVSLVTDSITSRRSINAIETIAGLFVILTGLWSIMYFKGISRLIITLVFILSGGIIIFKSMLKEK